MKKESQNPAKPARDGQEMIRSDAETASPDNKEIFHEIFDKVNDAIHIHEIREDGFPGRFVDVNAVACRMLQYTREELLLHGPLDFVTGYHSRPLPDIVEDLTTRGFALFETEHKRKDGSIVPVEVNAHVIVLQGHKRVLSVVRDITERKSAECALSESENKYKQLVTLLNEGIWVIDQHATTTFVNRKMAEILGYTPDEMIGKPAYVFTPADQQERTKQDIGAAKSEEPRQREIVLQRKDGTNVYTLIETADVRDAAGKYTGGIAAVIDITKRRMAEDALRESEQKYHSVVTVMSEGIVLQDADGAIRTCNASAERILGLAQDQMMGRRSVDSLWRAVHEDGSPFPGETHPAMVTLDTGKPCSNVIMGVHKPDGSLIWISINTQPLFYSEEMKPYAVVTSFSDITDRRQMERVVLASLKEKEILLKEIHHRVKNNLQIIASLLSLQSRYITDENVLNALKESQNRVKAMALVHERLYRSENLSEVALSDYLRYLIENLFRFYGANPRQVRMTFDAGDVKVDINKAIPIGLIINELVSNSLKHAFPEGKPGELSITVNSEGEAIVMIVRDTGPGIPADFDWRNTKSLGLQLVISLVEQLNGTIELERAGGTTFKISIPKKAGTGG